VTNDSMIEGGQFLIQLPAFTLGDLVVPTGGGDPVPTTILLRCPEYGAFLPLFTDLDLAKQALKSLGAPGQVILEVPSAATVRDLVRWHIDDGRATHVGIDVSVFPDGHSGLFAPIREALETMTPGRPVAACS
jgi:hypothetical protein